MILPEVIPPRTRCKNLELVSRSHSGEIGGQRSRNTDLQPQGWTCAEKVNMPNQSKSLKTYSRFKSIPTTPAFQGGVTASDALLRTFADLDLYPYDPGSSYKRDGSAYHKKDKHSKLVRFCDKRVTLTASSQPSCTRGFSCGSNGLSNRIQAYSTGYHLPPANCTANQLGRAVKENQNSDKSSFLSQISKSELKMSDSENNLQIDLDRMSPESKSEAEKEINELNSRPQAPPPRSRHPPRATARPRLPRERASSPRRTRGRCPDAAASSRPATTSTGESPPPIPPYSRPPSTTGARRLTSVRLI